MANRVEKVTLVLDDRFTAGMTKAAAVTEVMAQRLDRISGISLKAGRDMQVSARGVDAFRRETDRASISIDKLSGRLGLAARAVGSLGPAAVPVVMGATAALAGLAAQGMAVSLGAGVIVTAFQGVGDALEAVNKAQLEPTSENIAAARAEMEKLAPAAREAVRAMQDWRPLLTDIRDAAAQGFFPGYVDALDELKVLAPQVEDIFAKVGAVAGRGVESAAAGLAGSEGREFIDFVEREAVPTLTTFGKTAGNVASGLGDLIMAADPLSDLFGGGMLAASERFAAWADNVSQTEGYREFIDYVRETGPQVMETVGSVADMFLQVGEAASPLGGPVLQILETTADVLGTIADSPAGPAIMAAVTAMSALSLVTRSFDKVAATGFGKSMTTFSTDVERANRAITVARPTMRQFGQALIFGGQSADQLTKQMQSSSASIASHSREVAKSKMHVRTWLGANKGMLAGTAAVGAGFAASNAGLKMNNTLMFAGIGMMAGPWGAAAGAAIGATLDLAAAFDEGAKTTEDWRAEIAAAGMDVELLRGVVADLREATKGDPSDPGFWDHIKDGLTDSKAELAAPALKEAEAALDAATLSAAEFASTAGVAGASFTEMANAFLAANDILSGRSSMRAVEEAVDNATQALKENGRTLDINTEKGRENQAALDAIAGSAIAAAQDLEGTARVRVLTQARRDFINTAVAMGMPRAEARKLADQLGLLNRTHAKPKVTVDGSDAKAEVRDIQAVIDSLRGATVPVTVQGFTYRPQVTIAPKKKAGGGPIYGPGTATSDSIPAMLSNGEYVIRAAAVARYGVGFFDRANQMRLASGGSVGTSRSGSSQSGGGRREEDDERRKSAKEIKAEREERRKARRERAIERQEEVLRRAQDALDDVVQARSGLSSSVTGSLRSDPFARKSVGGWRTKLDWRANLMADINNAKAFNAARATLAKKGLDGAAAEALFAESDLATVQEFAGKSAAEIAEYEALFAQRESLTGQAGRAAGGLVYDEDVAEARRVRDEERAQLRAMRRRPRRQQRRSSRDNDNRRRGEGRGDGRRQNRREGGTQVDIYVQGDSSRDPIAMATETARRLAFEGG